MNACAVLCCAVLLTIRVYRVSPGMMPGALKSGIPVQEWHLLTGNAKKRLFDIAEGLPLDIGMHTNVDAEPEGGGGARARSLRTLRRLVSLSRCAPAHGLTSLIFLLRETS